MARGTKGLKCAECAIVRIALRPKHDFRPDFAEILRRMSTTSVPVVSIDIPSGWNVETGEILNLFEQSHAERVKLRLS